MSDAKQTVSDEQLVTFLKKCKSALRSSDSVIVVKENVTHPAKEREYDEQDKSWTRYGLAMTACKDLRTRLMACIVRYADQPLSGKRSSRKLDLLSFEKMNRRDFLMSCTLCGCKSLRATGHMDMRHRLIQELIDFPLGTHYVRGVYDATRDRLNHKAIRTHKVQR